MLSHYNNLYNNHIGKAFQYYSYKDLPVFLFLLILSFLLFLFFYFVHFFSLLSLTFYIKAKVKYKFKEYHMLNLIIIFLFLTFFPFLVFKITFLIIKNNRFGPSGRKNVLNGKNLSLHTKK